MLRDLILFYRNLVLGLLLAVAATPSKAQQKSHSVGGPSPSTPHGSLSPLAMELGAFETVVPETVLELRRHDESRSSSELRRRFYNLEQICFAGNDENTRISANKVDIRMKDLAEVLWKRMGAENFAPIDAPDAFLSGKQTLNTWKGRDLFLTRFRARSIEERCRLTELLLASAVARISLIEPSKPICSFRDFICENSKDALFQKDLKRLRWEFRYLSALKDKDLQGAPDSCKALLNEAKERTHFAEPNPKHHAHRWPLGRAFGMCARPMSAHYLDDAVVSERQPEPEGWIAGSRGRNLDWDEILKVEASVSQTP